MVHRGYHLGPGNPYFSPLAAAVFHQNVGIISLASHQQQRCSSWQGTAQSTSARPSREDS